MRAGYMVLADDLTGACDTAVKFASGDGSVRLVLSDLRSAAAESGPTGVLAYSTESRALASVEAYRRTRDAAQATGCRPIYKKVDSTLRGNVGAEIDALTRRIQKLLMNFCSEVVYIDGLILKKKLLFLVHGHYKLLFCDLAYNLGLGNVDFNTLLNHRRCDHENDQ